MVSTRFTSGTAQPIIIPAPDWLVQDDGNVVIYAPDGTALWATNTAIPGGSGGGGG